MKNKQPWLVLLFGAVALALLGGVLYGGAYAYYRSDSGCLRLPGVRGRFIRGDAHGRGSSKSPCVKANKSVDHGLEWLFEPWNRKFLTGE